MKKQFCPLNSTNWLLSSSLELERILFYGRRHICLNTIIAQVHNYLSYSFELSVVIMDVFSKDC
jgi:hypothetical protein